MYSVLYVDDDPQLLEIGRVYLQKYWNFSVTTVSSAKDALSQLQISRYDIIISDYQMPEMDGISFLKMLRENSFSEPFILFTGKGREEVVIEALNSGADFYLQKGGHPKAQFTELVNMIQKAVLKRRAELELLRVNQQSKSIINHLPDPTFVVDAGGTIIAWNLAMEKIAGVPDDAVVGTSLTDCSRKIFGIPRLSLADYIITKDEGIQKWYRNVHFEGNTVTAETKITFGRQEARNVWIKASPIFDNEGVMIGAIETLRDITTIRRNEEELVRRTEQLRETSKQLQDIINFIPDPTFAIDKGGRVIAWNQAIERLTGTDATAILGEGGHAYSLPFYAERRPTLIDLALTEDHDLHCMYDYILTENQHLVAEVYNEKICDGKGAHLWAVVAPLVDSSGNVTGAIESIRDITSRKELELELNQKYEELASSYEEIAAQNEEIRVSFDEIEKQKDLLLQSERRFRSLVEHLPDGVIIHRDGDVTYANPMACRILGYGDPAVMSGARIDDIIHPRCRGGIFDRIADATVSDRPFVEALLLKQDGSDVPVEITEIKVVIGGSLSVMTLFRDITEDFERRTALRQAKNKLKILSSITRHDIKNEVATVMAILDIVSLGDIPKDQAELLQRAFNPCENILEQLNTTLEYQNLGIMEPGWHTIHKLLIRAAVHHQVASAGYAYDGIKADVFADPLIQKVFENLVDNSIRHGKDLTMIRCHVHTDGDSLLLTYEDDGGGIADADKTRIFEDGYGKNTGLGLFLIHEILGMTGITIRECGVHGQGVRFEMNVPPGRWRPGPE